MVCLSRRDGIATYSRVKRRSGLIPRRKNWATPRIDRSGYCIENLSATRNELVPCPLLAETSVILTDGQVACCNWDYNGDILPGGPGNIRDTALADIWNSESLRKLRDKHARLDFTDLPRCASCGMTRPPVTDISVAGSTRYGYVRPIKAFSKSASVTR